MEQNNLVVTPDGKTWDEVIRDTSYHSSLSFSANGGPDNNNSSSSVIFTEYRGANVPGSGVGQNMGNKDWAIAYNHLICLRDGHYTISWSNGGQAGYETYLYRMLITSVGLASRSIGGIKGGDAGGVTMPRSIYYQRGDHLKIEGGWDSNDYYNNFQITRV